MGKKNDPADPARLPAAVNHYLETERSKDVEGQMHLFADDAFVRDEGREHRGLDALRQWKRELHSKFAYTVDPIEASVSGHTVRLLARLSGDFPGSPVELDHIFTLSEGKITSLVIE